MANRIALITGGGRGIGAATALLLAARAGYDVCVNYASDRTRAEEVASDCRVSGVRSVAVQADIGDPREVELLFSTCDEQLGAVTLLVNNAGIVGEATPIEDLDYDVLRRTFEVNVFGSICCAQQAVRRMSTGARRRRRRHHQPVIDRGDPGKPG